MTTRLGSAVLAALFLVVSCGDDSGGPSATDAGAKDAPPGAQDGHVATESGTRPGDGTRAGGDASTAPTVLTAHMEEACSTGLYSVNVSTKSEKSTCDDIQTLGIDYMQVLMGDSESKPPTAGRTYTVKAQSQVNIYPADGEATAVFLSKAGNQNVKSGTFTVDLYSGGAKVFTGSFDVTLDDGQKRQGTYLADFCPFDPGDCGD
jgi:hypothetical protein